MKEWNERIYLWLIFILRWRPSVTDRLGKSKNIMGWTNTFLVLVCHGFWTIMKNKPKTPALQNAKPGYFESGQRDQTVLHLTSMSNRIVHTQFDLCWFVFDSDYHKWEWTPLISLSKRGAVAHTKSVITQLLLQASKILHS